MLSKPILLIVPFTLALLAGCESSAPPGTNGGVEQLRLSMTPALRNAGVPDSCIAQLPSSSLSQVKGITSSSVRSSKGYLQRRQQLRTAAEKVCGDF
ncbi:hypothetical protein [Aliiruegeria sabulilitoris]|uniref:hypothetical protein n=1 Tax=Aliiruegeria sabulilitoris TaxID=1510458 RepID=UPI00082A27CB|nr:hypothetical protein [Aliiruegeria sabulilitoris]NDR58243.1 hypothetical protein [Pseudoruegeria sp. M32A2M]